MSKSRVWIVVLGVVISGCGRSTRVETGARDQVLHFGNTAEPKDLDPQTYVAMAEWNIDSALFEGLVNLANDGETILPGVAERWDLSPDGRVYTFHLRSDAAWSDGSPVTADDCLYGFRRLFAPELACAEAIYGFGISGTSDYYAGKNHSPESLGLRALDAHTFQIRLAHRESYFLSILGEGAPFVPLPRAVVERFGGGTRPGTAWTRPGNLVGNGAFVLAAWHPHQDLIVVRNPHYWDRARVRLREIHYYPLEDPAAGERAFRAGEVHTLASVPISKLSAYRQRSDPQLHLTRSLDTEMLLFNTTRPPFNDVRVRRALSLALDRNRLVPLVLPEAGTPAFSLTRPGTDRYLPPPEVDDDPAEARRLLAAAGYPGGAGFPATEIKLSDPLLRELLEAAQQVWQRELGLRLALAPEEQKTFDDDLSTKNYSLAAYGFFYGINAPETVLLLPLSDSPYNYTGWRFPAYDRAYRQATEAELETERRAHLDEMEEILHTETPLAPLFYKNGAALVSSHVRGWKDNALGEIDWRELWLAP